MKSFVISVFLLLFWNNVLFLQGKNTPRETLLINSGWKFFQGDDSLATRSDFDDSSWENVGLPHSFSIPYFMSKDFYVGYGWYRKCLNLDLDDLKKKLFLEFDGVFQEAEVFVNGKLAGTHVGGYTGFSVDISSCIKLGENQIAVRVNNLWKPDVAPRAGEHVFSGGIYRNVRLVKKEHCYVTWCGTFVTTPELEKNHGRSSVVMIETEISNESGKNGKIRLQTHVLDKNGELVTEVQTTEKIAAGESKKIVQFTPPVLQPHLWAPETPYLYKLITYVYHDDELVDCVETPFGFRWFEWTAENGFFLNGKPLQIKGVNVHQDQAGWGDAVTDMALRRDVNMMKEAGFNLIRGSHYPHAPAFSQACDEAGILLWSEAPFWGIGGFKEDGYWDSSAYPTNEKHQEAFKRSIFRQLEEMIRIHRNHPSIVVWSMGNEVFFSAPEVMPDVRTLLRQMVDLSHRLDSTRPAAIGGAQRPLGDERIDKIGDIAGYNGDGATQPDFQNPGIPNLVSEYGSVTADRPGEYSPGWGDLQRNEGWKGVPWRCGQAIWCGFDHGSIAGSALGKMGIVDYFRIPKRSWYWYRNNYAGIAPPKWPVDGEPICLNLKASKTKKVKTDGTDDVLLWISVCDTTGNIISCAPTVELKVISGPGEFPTGRTIRFEKDSDIRIMDGQAAISFRSYFSGKTIIEASSEGLKKARIEIEFEGENPFHEIEDSYYKERPYKRFVRSMNENIIQTFGRNNPVFASSSEAEHVPGMAADGNVRTYWKATDEDQAPYWMLDTEKLLMLKEIQIRFPSKEDRAFIIECSENQRDWTEINTPPGNNVDAVTDCVVFSDLQDTGRFIRVRFFHNKNAALSEVVVKGVVK